MNKSEDAWKPSQMPGELTDSEIEEIVENHPLPPEIHDPFWEWALEEDDGDIEGAEITRVFIPFTRGNADDSD
jgi:hypothetical protein